MGNFRNYSTIPIPKRPARNTPRPLPIRHRTQRKTTSSQTEPVIPDKKETINFSDFTRFNRTDYDEEKNYNKAISFINLCHRQINAEIEKNHPCKTGMFLLPTVPNYIPLFSCLVGKTENKNRKVRTNEKRKEKCNFTLRKTSKLRPASANSNPSSDVVIMYSNPTFDCSGTLKTSENLPSVSAIGSEQKNKNNKDNFIWSEKDSGSEGPIDSECSDTKTDTDADC